MFVSRLLRNVATGGNRLMNEAPTKDSTVMLGAAALGGLTALVYYVGYQAEGTSKASREHAKQLEANKHVVPK